MSFLSAVTEPTIPLWEQTPPPLAAEDVWLVVGCAAVIAAFGITTSLLDRWLTRREEAREPLGGNARSGGADDAGAAAATPSSKNATPVSCAR